MFIYFGTVVRAAPVKEGGSLFKLDWDTKTIIGEVPNVPIAPTLYHDPNARGNVRGCRGIRLVNDEVIRRNTLPYQVLLQVLRRRSRKHIAAKLGVVGFGVWMDFHGRFC